MVTSEGAISARSFALRRALWAVAAVALLFPLLAMQFTREVNWTPADFLAAALLLSGAGLAIELTVRVVRSPVLLAAIILAVVIVGSFIWADAAVGIL